MKKLLVLSAFAAILCLGCDDSGSQWNDDYNDRCTTGRCDRPGGSAYSSSSGAQNSGAQNSGAQNSGAQNSGAQNSGAQNSGAQNSGAQNSGAQDSGAQNSSAHSNIDQTIIAPTSCSYEGSTPNGAGCKHNCDCASTICANGKCLAANAHQSTAGSNAWTGNGDLEESDRCSEDAQCGSGLCLNGKCSDDCESYGCNLPGTVCRYNKCIPISADGGECNADNYQTKCALGQNCCNGFCTSGKCEAGVSCGDYLEKKDVDICDAGCRSLPGWDGKICGCKDIDACGDSMYCNTLSTSSYTSDSANICLAKKKNNQDCYLDQECLSGVCYKNDKNPSYYGGVCHNKVAIGESCYKDSQCESGYCYSDSCRPAAKTGGYCKESINCEAGNYCYNNKCKIIPS